MTRSDDVTQWTLLVLFIVGLMLACFWVLQPFLLAIVWAAILVLATWPLLQLVERHAGGSRTVAVVVMTVVLLTVLIVPFWLAVSMILSNLDAISRWIGSAMSARISPPAWLADVPLVGAKAAAAWAKLASSGLDDLLEQLAPYAGTVTRWFAAVAGGFGGLFVTLLMTAVATAVMYARGEVAARAALIVGRRLGGERGERAVLLAARSVKSVALAVVLTAIAQSVVAGVGLTVISAPAAHVLSAIIFMLCLVQIGPGPILVPLVIILYFQGDAVRATVLLCFSAVAMTVDQFIRPVLISKGGDLPLLLILPGVIGGLISFGLLGIFIGPAILAMAYTLLGAWLADAERPAAVADVPYAPEPPATPITSAPGP